MLVALVLHMAAFSNVVKAYLLKYISMSLLVLAAPPASDFPEMQGWVDKIVELGKIIGGALITVSLVIAAVLIATSLGGERRRAAAISALLMAGLGAVLFIGLTAVQSTLTHITQ